MYRSTRAEPSKAAEQIKDGSPGKIDLKKFPMVAEAIYLASNHSERTITAETPSEYDLGPRIQAQIAMIQRAIELSFL